MTFTFRSQAFCSFIHITIICHEISQFSVCPHQVVLCKGICIACDALFHSFVALCLLFMQLFLKILSGMASTVDPEQSGSSGAVCSRSTQFAYAILSGTLVYDILGHLP